MPVIVAGLDAVTLSMTNAATASRDLGNARAQVSASAPYARFVHDGTRPHRIVPRNRRALSWPGAAHPVRAVDHPGARAVPFLANALEADAPKVAALIGAALKAVADGGPATMVQQAFYNGAILIELDARAAAPSRTGALRQSITATVFGR